VLDAVLERPELDANRTACLGGSFGGYMTNWISGHTDRFDAIVTHAGLWGPGSTAQDHRRRSVEDRDLRDTCRAP
jgi:dienelactone hydrolase